MRSGFVEHGFLKFVEQDAETWRVIKQFGQLPDDDVSQADVERLYAALRKAETAWRARIVHREPK